MKKRGVRELNKKLLVALLLPMFFVPMMSFGYAHWTDKVRKQIRLHAGTVEIDIPWWHVDALYTFDVDCDDDVF
jgi:hypothetical protein